MVAILFAPLLIASRVAADETDPDACKMAPLAAAGALITPQQDVEIRSQSGNPAPGESTCMWSAVQRGLAADAPPEGRLSLAFYHFANRERAAGQTKRLTKTPQAPSLVITADKDDQLLRTEATTVVTRHGSDIVVVDASETRSLAREQAAWTYRLEAMALAAVGAKVTGPADPRALAPVCQLAAPAHVLALLTLSPSTLAADTSDGSGLRCYFSVKDASREAAGWVHNDGTAQVRREDLGTHAAALERQHEDRPFFKASELVATTDPTDRVIPTPQHPEEVEAVHGPYLVTLNLNGVTPEARADATWAYRVQRTALEIAGATVIADPSMPPDPVTPGPAPEPDAFAWHTSGHAAPSWSWLADPIVHVMVFMSSYRFLMMPVLIGSGILLATFGSSRKPPRPTSPMVIGYEPAPRRSRRWVLAPLLIGTAVGNLMFGTWISGILVNVIGAEGQATITGSHGTGTVYNSHHVRAYDVLIRTADGRTVESGFEDDDFNVYPQHNATTYPGKGDEFNVRYPQHYPGDFVILGEDDSPWAQSLRCSRLVGTRDKAERKLRFAPDIASYREAASAARKAETEAGCETPQ